MLTDIQELDLDVGFDLFADSEAAAGDVDHLEVTEGQSPRKKVKLDPDLLEPKVEIKETVKQEP